MHPLTPPLTAPPLDPPPLTGQGIACPDCGTPLSSPEPSCPACRLPLRGPVAARLWEVDTELAEIGSRRAQLLRERTVLLGQLRASAADTAPAGAPGPGMDRVPGREWGLRRVQNTLLGAGALLLSVAAAVFAAVTYDDLGLVGQALVLLTLTAGAAASVVVLARRGLTGTAEAMTAVTLALALLDAYAARRAGLAGLDGVDGRAYWATATGLLAAAAAAAAVRLPALRLPGLAAVGLAQGPVLVVVSEAEPTAAAWLLAGQAGLDVLALAVLRRTRWGSDAARALPPRAVGVAALLLGGLAVLVAAPELLLAAPTPARSWGSAVPDALVLVALAAVAALGAPLVAGRLGRQAVGALPVVLAAAAAGGLTLVAGTEPGDLAVVLAGVGAAGTLAGALVVARRVDWARGPQLAGLAVVAAGVALVAEHAALAATGPLTWPAAPWSLPAGVPARAAVAPGLTWAGDLAVLAALALLAATLGAVAWSEAGRVRLAAAVASGTAAWAVAAALPLALDLPLALALAWLLALGAALVGAAALLPGGGWSDPALLGGAATLGLASAWSAASEPTSLVVLPLAAVLLGSGSAGGRRPAGVLLLLAGLAAGAAVAALAVAAGAPADRAGFWLLAVPASLLALAAHRGLGSDRVLAAEGAAAVLATVALLLAAQDPGWLAWTLAATGLLGLATALRPERRRVAVLGGVLLAASSWVRLDEAGVGAPEPYVVPAALVALGLGHLRHRHSPDLSSRQAYAPGLAGLLLPSLIATFDDPGLTRPLLLGAVALGIALAGARARLAAPLVAGTGVLAVLALQQLAPLADALPRWTALAVAGAVLLGVGATYEQRRRDLARLREAYRSLA